MSHRFFFLVIVSCLSVLTACANSGPFEVTGNLIDASTGENLPHGRLILCPMDPDTVNCTISVGLTSSVSDFDDGKFHFNNVMQGEFALLYAADNSLNPAWDTRIINFDNTGETTGFGPPPIVVNIMESLGLSEISNCAISIPFSNTSGETVFGGVSGYLYSSAYQIAFILKDGAPLTVQIDGNTNIDIAVWDTNKECDNTTIGEFNPLPNRGN